MAFLFYSSTINNLGIENLLKQSSSIHPKVPIFFCIVL
nr:MAG TPA: hypothetical protein [Bacteriophage sp.]